MGKKIHELIKVLNLSFLDENLISDDIPSKQKANLIDKEGYMYYLDVGNLACIVRRDNKPNRFFHLNPYTEWNLNNYLKLNNINIKLIGFNDADNAKYKLQFYCPIHNHYFEKCWNEVKNGQYCPLCAKILNCENRKQDIEIVRKGFADKGYTLSSHEYHNNWEKLDYICNTHPEVGIQKVSWRELQHNGKCAKCYEENKQLNKIKNMDKSRSSLKSPQRFEQELHELYGDKFTIIKPYQKSKTKVILHCNDCNTDFSIKPNHILNEHLGCMCKPKSFGELVIKDYLDEHKINYVKEYRIEACKNIKALPFDFAIFDNNHKLIKLIEFQGKQHYEVSEWTSNQKDAENQFAQRQINDNIKRSFCKENNIDLLEIPYWEIKNIYKILDKEIQ